MSFRTHSSRIDTGDWTTRLMKPVDLLMQQATADQIFPGGVLLVSEGMRIRMLRAYGLADIDSGQVMTPDTVFDLASLTKPLATTPAVMRLVQAEKLEIDHSLGRLLPAFRGTDKAAITIRQLLAHESGLPDYKPYFEILRTLPPVKRLEALRKLLVAEPLHSPPGRQTLYSDLGFMILQWAVESLIGQRLDRFVTETVFRPLGLKDLFYVDLAAQSPAARFAATERCPWRGILLKGAVHDDNAYAMGGVAGHAGLFGTARDVFRLLATFLSIYHGRESASIFSPGVVRLFLSRAPQMERALGFDAPSASGGSSGRHFSASSVGHLGFTGTSFWMDLERCVIVILLTNRVHPSRDNVGIRAFRPLLHDTIIENLRKRR